MSRFEQKHDNGNSLLARQSFEKFYGRFTAVFAETQAVLGRGTVGKILVNFEKARVVPSLCRQDLQKQIIERYFRSI